MIALTVVLLIFLAVFAPLKVRLYLSVCPSELTATVRVWLYFVEFFRENVSVEGRAILLNGTVGDCVRLADVDIQGGKSLGKCITTDEVFVCLSASVASMGATAFLPAICAVVGCAAGFTNTKFGIVCRPTCQMTEISAVVKVRTCLAEVLPCLLFGK